MTVLPNGVYRIAKWGVQGHTQVLTLHDGRVTLLPPGEGLKGDQEWRLENLPDGKVAIQHPPQIFPSRSLSYEGQPDEGNTIILGPVSDFPTREWHIEVALQKPLPVPYFIRVPDKGFQVGVWHLPIYPPQLALLPTSHSLEEAWAFELVHKD